MLEAMFTGFDILRSSHPIHVASFFGDHAAGVEMLKEGADPNSIGQFNVTPLSCAAWNGHQTMVRLLLAHGADPSWKDYRDYLPLHRAVQGACGAAIAHLGAVSN